MNNNAPLSKNEHRNLIFAQITDAKKWRLLRPELFPKKGIMAWRFYIAALLCGFLFFAGLAELDITIDRILRGVEKTCRCFFFNDSSRTKGKNWSVPSSHR